MAPDIPYNISYTFDQDLRDLPDDAEDMARAVEYLKGSLDSQEMAERDRARILGQMGVLCRMLLRLDEAEQCCTRALELCRRLDDQLCEVVTSIRLAHVYQWQGCFDSADRLFKLALDRCERESDLAGYLDFACQHYGKSLFDQRRYAEAIEMFRRALAIREQKGSAELIGSSRTALQTAQRRHAQAVT